MIKLLPNYKIIQYYNITMNPTDQSNDTIAFAILKREREIQGFLETDVLLIKKIS